MAQLIENLQVDWGALIQKARSGDDDALATIVRKAKKYMLFVANAELGRDLQGKLGGSDIVQQSLLEAHQSIGTFRGSSKTDVLAWLKKIVMNNLCDQQRRYASTGKRDISREVSMEQVPSVPVEADLRTASWHLRRQESETKLMAAIGKLPPRQRRVLEARHRLGCSYSEIADQMQVTEVAARKLWSRGVNSLRDLMGDRA